MSADDPSGPEKSPAPAAPDGAPAPARRSPKVTATAVGAAATLIAALTGLITASQVWLGGSDGGSPPPTTTSTEVPTQPTLDRLLYSHALARQGPFAAKSSDTCKQRYRLGYRIEVSGRFAFCDGLIHALPSIAGLPSVRVEATVVWSSVPTESYKEFGAGGADLACRGNGEDTAVETYYAAGLTTSGHWEFSRYVRNRQLTVALGDVPRLASEQGEIRQLRLDCTQLPDGSVQLAFYVDGDPISTHIDQEPLRLGLIGVAAASFTNQPFAATFRDLRVYGPSS